MASTSNGTTPNGLPNGGPAKSRVRVPKRAGRKPVELPRTKFWDSAPPPTMKAEIKKRFLKAVVHFNQLEKYHLRYEYKTINKDEIRLLKIKPAARRNDDIYVSIETIADEEVGEDPKQEYEALSYHWGAGPSDKPVFIQRGSESRPQPKFDLNEIVKLASYVPDHAKGQRFYVRPSLDNALRYLRDEENEVVLWVDALCINQLDVTAEKPAQIAKMTEIYSKARNVCIWLGVGTPDLHDALNFVLEVLDMSKLEKLCKDKTVTKKWSDLLDLMRCSWFSRRWVIQELALARDATIHCGDCHVHWQDFADAIGLFVVKFDDIRALFRQSQDNKIYKNFNAFSVLEPLGAKVLVDAITNTFRKSVDGKNFEPVSSLEALVSNLSTFESSDPRDTIYALLNISRESWRNRALSENCIGPPKPNYDRNLLKVYIDFLAWVVEDTGSIDIICRQWALPEKKIKGGSKNSVVLPSWVQVISKSTWGTQEQGFNGRINGDSIVGRVGRQRYNASHGMKTDARFSSGKKDEQFNSRAVGLFPCRSNTAPGLLEGNGTERQQRVISNGPACMFVSGLEIDEIRWTSGAVANGIITKECLEKGGWFLPLDGKSVDKAPDKLWRTLVADRGPDGENPPPWYHRVALHCMALATNNGHINTGGLLEDREHDELSQVVKDYLKRVQAVTWNRKFIEGKQEQLSSGRVFGLGPPDTKEGDRICVLYGCSVPCILRPCNQNGDEYFQFVGEAYIYGNMDGEALMPSAEEEQRKTKCFPII